MKSIFKFIALFFILTICVFSKEDNSSAKIKNYVKKHTNTEKTATNIYKSIMENSKKHDVEPELIAAIIKVESDFNHSTVSTAGARGIMQLMPKTAKLMKVNPSNLDSNIKGGTKYIAWCLQQQNNNLKLALAAYNAGIGNVKKYKGIPPFRETQNYVKRVLKEYNYLKA
ncbi:MULTISPECIES: lytic transglycosylase domain-containing protein [Cetobacterium]|uniref:Lytic transglycosylase domain-containing protein n=1 Tax=Candidatus Cetobacterium colombiensis TaxID=3073100 RepID=A0ABU4W7U3_9FUSO|nr:lytic transglycosylase domain-containing protein [Candidatus Cetobacterium colombiensis]MDX8335579.1 lytic transglycosylase domain-containing protein [Candidatus Cetobacterium colombiensis]